MSKDIEKYSEIVEEWRKKRLDKITMDDIKSLQSLLAWAVELGMEVNDSRYVFSTKKLFFFVKYYLQMAVYGFIVRVSDLYRQLVYGRMTWNDFRDEIMRYLPYEKEFENIYTYVKVLADILDFSLGKDFDEYYNAFLAVYDACVYSSNIDEFASMFKYALKDTPFDDIVNDRFLILEEDRAINKDHGEREVDLFSIPVPYVIDWRFVLYLPIMYIAAVLLDRMAMLYFLGGLLVDSLPFVAVKPINLFLLRILRGVLYARNVWDRKKLWFAYIILSMLTTSVLIIWNGYYVYSLLGFITFWLGEYIYYYAKTRSTLFGNLPVHDVLIRLSVGSMGFVLTSIAVNYSKFFSFIKVFWGNQ